MSVEQMRAILRKAYGNPYGRWAKRVDAMPDDQVRAIYFRMLEQDPKRLSGQLVRQS